MLLGKAAVAMWWTIDPAMRAEFQHWHSYEHFPERMGIPGFRRGSRWAERSGGPGFFVMYELDDPAILDSPGYLDRLNHPTPWSTKMMPHHLGMVRSLCRVAASHGGGVAGYTATIRFSPAHGGGDAVRTYLDRRLPELVALPGLSGAHLLLTETPAQIPQTAEQRIRGADKSADWVLVLAGYDAGALHEATANEVAILPGEGAADTPLAGSYALCLSLAATDLAA